MTDGLDIPDKLSEWTKGGIVEHIGSDEEHTDTFYRHGNLGAEQDKDGTWEAYTIVDGHPIKVKGDMMSFEEVVEFFKGSFCSKRLADSDDEDDESDDFDEDEDFDEDDEPEHPQGDDEIGVTFILKSISEMMDEGYDGCAVKKSSKELRDKDRAAKDKDPWQAAIKNKGYVTNSVGKKRTKRGQVTLNQMHELNPNYIEAELGGEEGGNFKNEHSDEIRRRNKERADNKELTGYEDDIYAGTGKNAYSNYMKSLFGADDPNYYKRGGALVPMSDVYQQSEAPMIRTRGDKVGSYEGKPYSAKPFLTDILTIAQMNDAIQRSFVKGHGQKTYSLDLPRIAGVDLTMLDKPYQLYTDKDDVGDLTGDPISVSSYGNMLNPHLFTYGTKRSLHPVDLTRGQMRVKYLNNSRRNHGQPLIEAKYGTAAKLAEYLQGLAGLNADKYRDEYNEAITHIPVKELISFLRDPKYADLREAPSRV